MIDTPQIIKSTPVVAAVIRLTIPKDQIQQVMGPAIGEVIAAVTAQGIGPSGPVFSHHFKIDPKVWDFEVGVPVSKPVTPVGRVQPGQLPETTVAATVYRGPYESLGDAWGKFDQWIAANGHTAASDLWEFYAKGPESSTDPAQWQTQLNRPLVR